MWGFTRMSGRFGSPLRVLASLALGAAAVSAQNSILTCQATVNPILVRGEGLTERMGDILLQCTGGIPNSGVSGNLTIFLSVPMTNRIDSNGYSDLMLSVDNGQGPLTANVQATYLNAASLSFSGLAFNLSPAGGVGINLAIQDAVATANLLAEKLRSGPVSVDDLRKVQTRREWPTRLIQGMQVFIHRRVVTGRASGRRNSLPFVVRLLKWFPVLRQLPARFIGLGPRPEHFRSPTVT